METYLNYNINELTVDAIYEKITEGLVKANLGYNPDVLKPVIERIVEKPLFEVSTFITYDKYVGNIYIRRLKHSKLITVFGFMNDENGELFKEVEMIIKFSQSNNRGSW